MRTLLLVALVIFCITAPIGIWIGIRFTPRTPVTLPSVSYGELVAIMLTGVTVSLAILAVFVGVLAIWGYRSIKDEAAHAAKQAVNEAISKNFSDESIGDMIREQTRVRLDALIGQASLYPTAFPVEPDQEAGQGDFAEKYPGEATDEAS